jgi:hypothetical protein
MKSIIEEIIKASLRYPSGDNIQPWRFRIMKDDSVEIHCIWLEHKMDYHYFISYVGLGVLLETLKIQGIFRGVDMKTKVNYGIHAKVGENPWATVEFSHLKQGKNIQYELLPNPESFKRRFTDRRKYLNKDIPQSTLEKCMDFVNAKEGVSLHILQRPNFSKEFLSSMSKVDGEVFRDPELLFDILQYCNLHEKNKNKLTGMPPESLALGQLEVWLLKKTYDHKSLREFMSRYIFPNVLGRELQSKVLCSSLIFSVEGDTDDEASLVKIGETVGRIWPWLAGEGIVAQPLSVTSIFSWLVNTNRDDRVYLRDKIFRSDVEDLLHSSCSVGLVSNKKNPFWSFRAGYPIDENIVKVPRLGLDAVMIS